MASLPSVPARPLRVSELPPAALAEAIVDTLVHRIGKDAGAARPYDWLAATILTVRDDIIDRWMESTRSAHAAGAKFLENPIRP